MKNLKGLSNSVKLQGAFLVLGLTAGLMIAVPATWVLRPPQGEPKQPKLTGSLTKEQLVKFIGAATDVKRPSAQTNGYTVVEFESDAKGLDGTPVWGATILLK